MLASIDGNCQKEKDLKKLGKKTQEFPEQKNMNYK